MKLIAPLITTVVLIAMVALSVSVVLGVAVAVVLYRGGRRLRDSRSRSRAAAAHRRAELLARAEIQHRWYIEGDPRGTYGRYLYEAPSRASAG